MTFYVQGLSGHELMSLTKVFKEPVVEKTEAIVPQHAINEKERHTASGKHKQHSRGAQVYQTVSQQSPRQTAVFAAQIMRSPVVTLNLQATVTEVLMLFREKQVRHLPIVSTANLLVGIISERDVLRHLSGLTGSDQPGVLPVNNEQVARLMKSPVLTASRDTDIRYIARLFVEQRVGALPIVSDGKLKGIITRSDVLTAVMRHFTLELWA